MNTKTLLLKDRIAVDAVHRVVPAVFALLFGGFLILGVGFIQPSTLHNAAHDGRHAMAFPCH